MPRPPDDGLSRHKGVPDAPAVNPRLRSERVDLPPVDALFEGLRRGDRNALSRAITLVESTRASDRETGLALLDRCLEIPTEAMRVGFSGVPGVGKSTMIDALGVHLVESGKRVAVLAVDPTSERSGGSILGDKTRMGRLASLDEAFIRPSPSGGALGGVGRSTRPVITLVEAAGFDVVIVETVGVGQSETAVRHMVDTFVLLALAGSGDELQGIKRGITEAADVVAVTKADGAGRNGALLARDTLDSALRLLSEDDTGWRPTVHAVSVFDHDSVESLWRAVESHRSHLVSSGALTTIRSDQAVRWLRDELTDRMLDRLRSDPSMLDALRVAEKAVSEGDRHAYRAADDLVRKLVR